MFSQLFIRRPILATVCSLIIMLAGAVAIPSLPIARYPELTPPAVSVSAFYTGAYAQAVESAVTTPLEQVINGVEGGLRLDRSEIPQAIAGERQFRADGFDLTAGPPSGAAGSRADLRGYSVSEPLIEVVCNRGVRNCAFYTHYRNSRIAFYLPQSEIPDAHRVARGIIDLLDRHLVSGGEQP